jgi:plastocyanin
MTRVPAIPALLAVLTLLAACGSGEQPAHPMSSTTAAPSATAGAPLTPGPGGVVISIDMTTDPAGNNKFTPAEFTAHPGDVLRFTLSTGVHNVNFLADSNPALKPPPAPSPLLQLPGQAWDIAVDFPVGRYYFQCDPHALLGMVGHLTVEAAKP